MPETAARSRARTIVRAGALLFLLALLGGCLLPPAPKTDAGQDVFNLYLLVLAFAAVVFIGVEGFILYAIFRYRRDPEDDTLPEQHHGNTKVEILWTAIPTVIVAILFVMSVITLGSVEARSEEPGVTINVVGRQWSWVFTYEEEGAVITGASGEATQLVVPVGEPVRLVLESDDVNHAFFVPDFLLKRDLIDMGENASPNEIEFTVTEEGTYAGQCAEFCGVGHADMIFEVVAMPREQYDPHIAAIAAGEPPPPPPGGADCGTTIELTTQNIAFDKDSIEAPAGEDFCIRLVNNDSVDHDVGIQETEFNGEDIGPGEEITYLIPAMEAGDYTFYCTLHPTNMVGDLTVTE